MGPLLFVLFINDLSFCLKKCSFHLYADDTVIYFSDKDPSVVERILNYELIQVERWMNINKLKLNCEKTVDILFGTRHMLTKHNDLDLQIRGTKIRNVDSVKYLGIFIDNELKWNTHIEHMCSKIGKMISFLGRLRYFVNESILKLIYSSVILPHFDYADIIWQSASKKYLDLLQKLQNRAGRIILRIDPYSHTSTSYIHDILKWKKLSTRQKEHMHVMMFKIVNDLAPEYMILSFPIKSHSYSLRSKGNLSLPRPKTNNCKRSFLYRGATMYNQLPAHICTNSTVQSFKRNVQAYLDVS